MIPSNLHTLEDYGIYWDIISLIAKDINKINLFPQLSLDSIELGLIEESFDISISDKWRIYNQRYQTYDVSVYIVSENTFMIYMSNWTLQKFIILYGMIDDINKEIIITRYYKQNFHISDAIYFMSSINNDLKNYLIKINTYRNWTKHEHYKIMWAFEDKYDPMPGLIHDHEQ